MIIRPVSYEISRAFDIPQESSVFFVGQVGDIRAEFNFEQYEASNAGFSVDLIEGVTFTGTQLTGYALNRSITRAHQMGVFASTNVTGGQVVRVGGVPMPDAPQGRVVSTSPVHQDWHLKKNTNYAIKISNLNSSVISFIARLGWAEYEVL